MAEKGLDEEAVAASVIQKDWQAPVIIEMDYSETKNGIEIGPDMESLGSS